MGDAECGIFRRTAHRKFVHVQTAEDNRSRRPQFFDDGRIVRRNEPAEDFRAAIERLSLDGEDVLDRDGNAQQRLLRMRHAGRDFPVGRVGLGERVGGVKADEGVDFPIHADDLVQA